MKAEGGWAGICTESCSIHPEVNQSTIDLHDHLGRGRRHQSSLHDGRGASLGRAGRRSSWVPAGSRTTSPRRYVARCLRPLSVRAASPRSTPTRRARTISSGSCGCMPRRRGAPSMPASTSSTSTAPRACSRPTRCRAISTVAPTTMAARSRTARGFWIEALETLRRVAGDHCAIATRFAIDDLAGPWGIEMYDEGLRWVELADPARPRRPLGRDPRRRRR